MIALDAPNVNAKDFHFPSSLPLPDNCRGHGLSDCLIAVAPLIQQARDCVRRGAQRMVRSWAAAPFDPEAIEESLAAKLGEQLLMMMNRVVVLELNASRLEGLLDGDTPEERFRSYLIRLQQPEVSYQLFSDYPVLRQQIANRLDKWSAFSLEFLKHLRDDWDLVGEFFATDPGMLVEIQSGRGDMHDNGRSVLIASFASGARIVYKPRSLAVGEHFQQLLAWLNDRGVEPGFRELKVLDRGDHGWAEFVAAAPCLTDEEVSRFYRRQGGYLAILYALEASDFHCENLIAAGEHPMLIDLEALFHPRIENASSDRADVLANTVLGDSTLRVGLLPQRFWGSQDDPGVDLSGLGSAAGQLSPRGVPQWEGAGTDEMRIVRRRVEISASANRPSLAGEEVTVINYVETLASGFASTYRLLLEHRSELLSLLDRFSQDEVRVIARSTHTYGALFYESFHPDVLRDESARMAIFNRLKDAVADCPSLDRLIPAEQRDLLNGDIPLFTTRPSSRHLWTSRKECLENFFDLPGKALVERRVLQLCEQDLAQQLWIVRASIATLASSGEKPKTTVRRTQAANAEQLTQRELVTAASAIGDRLSELAISGDGDTTWIGLSPVNEREWHLAPVGLDLYDGLPGIVLFLSHLGLASGEPRYTRLAKSALTTLRRQANENRDISITGAFAGWGGLVYLLSHLGVIWAEQSLFDETDLLLDLLPELIERDQALDIIGGSAGCALGLRSIYRCRPSAKILALIRACGERLLRTSQPMAHGIGWACGNEARAPLTGFAHGSAGIAYALLEIAALTHDSRFERAALSAFDYERSLFSPKHGNWPDLRNNGACDFAAAWCHGAPGIGLSRICALPYMADPVLMGEIKSALSATLTQGFGCNHTLCHGDLGNADILLSASEMLAQSPWQAHANHVAATAIESACESGWICGNPLGVESPGLMTGIAGIGYAFLRLAAPQSIPSVLALAPPVLP